MSKSINIVADASRKVALQSYNRYNFDMMSAEEHQLADYKLDESVFVPKVKQWQSNG